MRKVYEQRRNWFVSALNEIPGVHCEMPEGAFYAWVRFELPGKDSEQVCTFLMEKAGVVGGPGYTYGEEGGCYMRFSFATATGDLELAVKKIKAAIQAET